MGAAIADCNPLQIYTIDISLLVEVDDGFCEGRNVDTCVTLSSYIEVVFP
jgi:hypothetical protein